MQCITIQNDSIWRLLAEYMLQHKSLRIEHQLIGATVNLQDNIQFNTFNLIIFMLENFLVC